MWGDGEPRARKTALGREELLYKNPAWVEIPVLGPTFFFSALMKKAISVYMHAAPPASRSATFAVRKVPLLRRYCSKGGVAKPKDDALAEAQRGKGGADVKVPFA